MIVRRFVDEVITQRNIDSAAQYVWEDVVKQVPLPGQGPALTSHAGMLESEWSITYTSIHRGVPSTL